VPPAIARELAQSVDGIFIDTSARNDENVNLLFQRVAERVLHVREYARNHGLEADGIGAIPVTPGASINEQGKVVKAYPKSSESGSSSRMRKHHPTSNLGGDSPDKTTEKKRHSRGNSNISDGSLTEEIVNEGNSPMGLSCMGPLMECSSAKGDSVCIIC